MKCKRAILGKTMPIIMVNLLMFAFLCVNNALAVNFAEVVNGNAEYAKLRSGSHPRSIHVTDNFIYVADDGLKQISIWDNTSSGDLVKTFNGSGLPNATTMLVAPHDIAVANDGEHMAIMDGGAIVIYKFTEVTSPEQNKTVNFEFCGVVNATNYDAMVYAFAVDFDNDDNLYMLDNDNGRLVKFVQTVPGDFSSYTFDSYIVDTSKNSMVNGRGFSFDRSGAGVANFILASRNNKNISLFNQGADAGLAAPSYNVDVVVEYGDAKNPLVYDPFDVNYWTTANGTKVVLVADSGSSSIKIFGLDGNLIESIGSKGERLGSFSAPSGVRGVDGTDRIFVADTSNRRVQCFDLLFDWNGNGIADDWERENSPDGSSFINPDEDFDNDGLTNLQEYLLGTSLTEWDSDGDGFSDGYEYVIGTNPLSKDSFPTNNDVSDFVIYTEKNIFAEDGGTIEHEGRIILPAPATENLTFTLDGEVENEFVFSSGTSCSIDVGSSSGSFYFHCLDGLKVVRAITFTATCDQTGAVAEKTISIENMAPTCSFVVVDSNDASAEAITQGFTGTKYRFVPTYSDPAVGYDSLTATWIVEDVSTCTLIAEEVSTNKVESLEMTFNRQGSYKVLLIVKDKDDKEASFTRTISIRGGVVIPTPTPSPTGDTTIAFDNVLFDNSGNVYMVFTIRDKVLEGNYNFQYSEDLETWEDMIEDVDLKGAFNAVLGATIDQKGFTYQTNLLRVERKDVETDGEYSINHVLVYFMSGIDKYFEFLGKTSVDVDKLFFRVKKY